MRPHKLTIENFGPFSKKAEIDFDKMGNGLYLISGDTGAGKTTIFDALVYALFGKASGSARSGLKTVDFHSDFAKHVVGEKIKRDPMLVELEFSAKEHTYTITRTMNWGKAGVAQKATKEATLSDQNGVQIKHFSGDESKGEVTAFITELLGMDADQFSQIIMLSQGEFRKFLEASSKERGAILGKIYDNSIHKDVEARIKAVQVQLENRRVETKRQITSQYMQVIKNVPEEMAEAIPEDTIVDDPEKLLEFIALVKTDRERLQKMLASDIDLEQDEKDALDKKYVRAEKENALFSQLRKANQEKKDLQEQKQVIESLKEKTDAAERAERVLPKEAVWKSSVITYKATEKKRTEAHEQLEKAKDNLEELKKVKENAETTLNPQVETLSASIIQYKGVLGKYDDVQQAETAFKEATANQDNARTEKGNADQAEQQHMSAIAECNKKLEELKDISEASVRLKQNDCTTLSTVLEKLGTVQTDLGEIQKSVEEFDSFQNEYTVQKEIARSAVDYYSKVYKRFLDGQAGFLAENLRNQIKENGSAVCPVCGQKHDASTMDQFAQDSENTPTREEVDAAKTAADDAGEKEKKLYEDVQDIERQISSKQNSVLEMVNALLERTFTWEDIQNGDIIRKECQDKKEALEAAKAELKSEQTKLKDKNKLLQTLKGLNDGTEEIKHRIQAAEEAFNKAVTEYSEAKGRYTEIAKLIEEYPASKKDAEQQIVDWEQEKKRLTDAIDQARNDVTGCEKEINTLNGNIQSLDDHLKMQKLSVDESWDQFQRILSEAGFDTEASYHMALDPDRTGDLLSERSLRTWIAEQRQIIQKYDEEVHDNENEIQRLTKETANLQEQDLQELAGKISEISANLKKHRDEHTKVSNQVSNVSDALDEIIKLQQGQKKLARALEKVNPLNNTANGNLKFETYVLDYFFESILNQANNHLNEMSGGQYQLISKKTGDNRGEVGLDMRIYDENTQKERATESLSGGESFKVSLSLALGLSDIAQQKSTGQIQIDCMFIDEGFGSLDEQSLQKALKVLDHLAAGQRQIGIISHVESLEQYLDQKKFVVKGSKTGSTVETKSDL